MIIPQILLEMLRPSEDKAPLSGALSQQLKLGLRPGLGPLNLSHIATLRVAAISTASLLTIDRLQPISSTERAHAATIIWADFIIAGAS